MSANIEPTKSASTMTIFTLVKTRPEFLAMTPDQRWAQGTTHLRPILERHAPAVQVRWFDTEFFAARVTDIWVWEVTDLAAYQQAIEALRETPFWDRYFEIVEILPGVENAYAKNYGRDPITV